MKNLMPLMQREWLQHRLAWTLLMLVPLAIAVLPLLLGDIQIDSDFASRSGPELALLLGTLAIALTAAVIFLLLWVTSLFMASGIPRRDHADRSVEFWLSLPTGHGESFAAPMLVHLLLVPAAALVVGLAGGYVISALVVTRFVGIGEWLSLPWGLVMSGTGALVLRVMAGLPLAALWLLPLVLLAMVANALFRRWGLPVLVVALVLGSVLLNQIFGQPLLGEVLAGLGNNAATSLMGASGESPQIADKTPPAQALAALPAWALGDLAAAVRNLASPLFAGAVAVSAALFMALVIWRQRGAGASSA